MRRKTCPHCGSTNVAQRSRLSRPTQPSAEHLTAGAQIGGALGAVGGRAGIAIGSVAGAVLGGLLSAQRWWPVSDDGWHCHACEQDIPSEAPTTHDKR